MQRRFDSPVETARTLATTTSQFRSSLSFVFGILIERAGVSHCGRSSCEPRPFFRCLLFMEFRKSIQFLSYK